MSFANMLRAALHYAYQFLYVLLLFWLFWGSCQLSAPKCKLPHAANSFMQIHMEMLHISISGIAYITYTHIHMHICICVANLQALLQLSFKFHNIPAPVFFYNYIYCYLYVAVTGTSLLLYAMVSAIWNLTVLLSQNNVISISNHVDMPHFHAAPSCHNNLRLWQHEISIKANSTLDWLKV